MVGYRFRNQKGATSMVQKQVLNLNRVRRLPKSDWSWVDRRFLRQFASSLTGDAVFLYFTLVAVSDKNGLSYYSDNSLALMIRTSLQAMSKARLELVHHDLIAYQAPLVQVLSLPLDPHHQPRLAPNDSPKSSADANELQSLIAALAQKSSISRLDSHS
jgi:predicted transcriptional regulator with HTH domain